MAGDWIKFEKATLDKPEVFEMAGLLNIDPDAVIGKLLRVWDWFDDQSLDGYAPVTLAAQLNRNTGCAEFTAAMQKVGWMIMDGDRIAIPNFQRHNGQTAKDRSLSAKRMAKSRGKSYGNSATSSVTKAQPEKRREEKRIVLSKDNTLAETQPIGWSSAGGWEGITEQDSKEWSEAYPACDIPRQLSAMTQWLKSNPQRAKKKLWRKFLTSWLERDQERGGGLKSTPTHRAEKQAKEFPEALFIRHL